MCLEFPNFSDVMDPWIDTDWGKAFRLLSDDFLKPKTNYMRSTLTTFVTHSPGVLTDCRFEKAFLTKSPFRFSTFLHSRKFCFKAVESKAILRARFSDCIHLSVQEETATEPHRVLDSSFCRHVFGSLPGRWRLLVSFLTSIKADAVRWGPSTERQCLFVRTVV